MVKNSPKWSREGLPAARALTRVLHVDHTVREAVGHLRLDPTARRAAEHLNAHGDTWGRRSQMGPGPFFQEPSESHWVFLMTCQGAAVGGGELQTGEPVCTLCCMLCCMLKDPSWCASN